MSWTRLLALLALLFAVLTTINAVNKGGDAAVFFEGGRRFLHAEPLYEGSSAAARLHRPTVPGDVLRAVRGDGRSQPARWRRSSGTH